MNIDVFAYECDMSPLALSLTVTGESVDCSIYKLRSTRTADLAYNEKYL